LNAIMVKLEEATFAAGRQPAEGVAPRPPSDAKEVQAQIKKLEASLAEVPDDEEEIKAALQRRIAAKDQLLEAARPAGAQLDQARAALIRTKGLQSDAQAAVEASFALGRAEEAEVAEYEKEVMELELQPGQQDAAAAATEQPMEHAQEPLCSMLEDLRTDPFVPEEQIMCAAARTHQLVQGLATTLGDPRRVQRVQADAAKRGLTTRRDGEQPMETSRAATESSSRHAGVQAPKRLISDHFEAVKAIVMVPRTGGARAGDADVDAEAPDEERHAWHAAAGRAPAVPTSAPLPIRALTDVAARAAVTESRAARTTAPRVIRAAADSACECTAPMAAEDALQADARAMRPPTPTPPGRRRVARTTAAAATAERRRRPRVRTAAAGWRAQRSRKPWRAVMAPALAAPRWWPPYGRADCVQTARSPPLGASGGTHAGRLRRSATCARASPTLASVTTPSPRRVSTSHGMRVETIAALPRGTRARPARPRPRRRPRSAWTSESSANPSAHARPAMSWWQEARRPLGHLLRFPRRYTKLVARSCTN